MVFFLVRRELSGGVAVNALIAVAGTGYQVADAQTWRVIIFHRSKLTAKAPSATNTFAKEQTLDAPPSFVEDESNIA